MGITSFAQNFEDVILWRALGHVSSGIYIDVGAHHPDIDSVSKAFHDRGWRGVHVEPGPDLAQLLREKRPGDVVIQAIVAMDRAIHPFYETPGGGLSTADREVADHHFRGGVPLKATTAVSVTLDEVLDQAPGDEIHWLKIDVEGFEEQVLRSWQKSTRRPWIVVVEATYPKTRLPTYDRWESLILSKGYSFAYDDGLNRFYLSDRHQDLHEFLREPPNVFDEFQINPSGGSVFSKDMKAFFESEIFSRAQRIEQLESELGQVQATLITTERDRQLERDKREDLRDYWREATLHAEKDREFQRAMYDKLGEQWREAAADTGKDREFQRAIYDKLGEQWQEAAANVAKDREFQRVVYDKLGDQWREAAVNADKDREFQRSILGQLHELGDCWRRASTQAAEEYEQQRGTSEKLNQALARVHEIEQRLIAREAALGERFAGHERAVALQLEVFAAQLEAHSIAARRSRLLPWPLRALVRGTGAIQRSDDAFGGGNGTISLKRLLSLPAEEFLGAAYHAILGREIDAEGSAHYSAKLAQGRSRSSILVALASSTEARQRESAADLASRSDEDFIEALYLRQLGRPVDPDGRQHYLGKLRKGISRKQIVQSLRNSSEGKRYRAMFKDNLDLLVRRRTSLFGWRAWFSAAPATAYYGNWSSSDIVGALRAEVQSAAANSGSLHPTECLETKIQELREEFAVEPVISRDGIRLIEDKISLLAGAIEGIGGRRAAGITSLQK